MSITNDRKKKKLIVQFAELDNENITPGCQLNFNKYLLNNLFVHFDRDIKDQKKMKYV